MHQIYVKTAWNMQKIIKMHHNRHLETTQMRGRGAFAYLWCFCISFIYRVTRFQHKHMGFSHLVLVLEETGTVKKSECKSLLLRF